MQTTVLTMSALTIPWSKHRQLVIEDAGPWTAKTVTAGVFACCPLCHTFPVTKLGQEERGAIASPCHKTTAELVEHRIIAWIETEVDSERKETADGKA